MTGQEEAGQINAYQARVMQNLQNIGAEHGLGKWRPAPGHGLSTGWLVEGTTTTGSQTYCMADLHK